MENPLMVFVSSVILGMEAERHAIQEAIRAIPLTRPWLFEYSGASSLPLLESYLSKVRTCDIFVLLLGHKFTDPVKLEVTTAQEAGRPMLVFLHHTAPQEVVAYASSLDLKYAKYCDSGDLTTRVAEAVSDELITGYRRHQVPGGDLARISDHLQKLVQGAVGIDVGGDRIAASGPVATRGSAASTGSGIAVVGNHNVIIGGNAGRDAGADR